MAISPVKKKLHLKSKEQRTDLKDFKRGKKPRTQSKSQMLDMVEVLLANGRAKYNGICRHNHSISVLSTGKVLIDGESKGSIEPIYIESAKHLIKQGYHIKYVRNSPVIYDPDDEPTNVTVGDIIRR
jgi:hypothetical protein